MAGAARIIAVDVGICTAKVGEFSVHGNGVLTLHRYGIEELAIEQGRDDERFPVVTQVLQNLLRTSGIKPGRAILSVSGQSVFMRFVKLPPVDAVQVEQMVGFEAQQNVPFPINEVAWDYQMMPGRGTGGEMESIIVAMKSDVLERENQAVEACGVQTRLIDVAPLALYNAFRYNYEPADSCTLLIDLGAKTTNLLFIEKNHLWSRPIPIAGNLISQNICNEFQEPFAAAETLKKGKGYVSLGGAYADPDDREAARISKLIRTAMTRLHNEINRSISFYRSEKGGTAPKRVFLAGGTSQIPYLDMFLGEKLNLPIEFFNPLKNVTIAPGVDVAHLTNQSCFMGELVGLALREAGSCPLEISLTPPLLKDKLSRARRQPFLYTALAAWLILAALPSIADYRETEKLRAAAEAQSTEAQSLTTFADQIAKEAPAEKQLESAVNAATKLLTQRDDWVKLLNDFNSAMAQGIWITSFEPKISPDDGRTFAEPDSEGAVHAKGKITHILVKGLYHFHEKTQQVSPSAINDLVRRLAKLSWFEIDENNLSKTNVNTVVTPASGELALDFTLHLKLKRPLDVTP